MTRVLEAFLLPTNEAFAIELVDSGAVTSGALTPSQVMMCSGALTVTPSQVMMCSGAVASGAHTPSQYRTIY